MMNVSTITQKIKKTIGLIFLINFTVGVFTLKNLSETKHLLELIYEGPFLSGTHSMSAKFNFERADSMVRYFISMKGNDSNSSPTRQEIDEQINKTKEDIKIATDRTNSPEGKKLSSELQGDFVQIESFLKNFLVQVESDKLRDSKKDQDSGQLLKTISNFRQTWITRPERTKIQKNLSDLADIAINYRAIADQKEDNSITLATVLNLFSYLITAGLATYLVVSVNKKK